MGQGRLPGRAPLLHRRRRSSPGAGIALGLYVSFTGILTFKKSESCARSREVPADRILVETDAPYLAPVPYRGKRNEPAYVRRDRQGARQVRGVTLDEIARQTTENFFRLFAKVPRAGGGRRMSLRSRSWAAARPAACRASASAGAPAIRQPEEPAAALLAAGRAPAGRRRHPRPGRHLAGPARAAARRQRRLARRRALHP